MKRILIFSGCLLLILLLARIHHNAPVSASSHSSSSLLVVSDLSIASADDYCSSLLPNQLISSKNTSLNIDRSYLLSYHIKSHSLNPPKFYIPKMLGWAIWIWLPLRGRQPYRNPQRRFRLNKKQRRRLRRGLFNLLAQESTQSTVDSLSSSLELA